MDGQGRVTITVALRQAVGIAERGDVLALHDAEAGTVTMVAASRVDEFIAAALDGLRRPAPHAGAADTPAGADSSEPASAERPEGRRTGTGSGAVEPTDDNAGLQPQPRRRGLRAVG
jgi:hypothetical protein